jgi:hypothetical protein
MHLGILNFPYCSGERFHKMFALFWVRLQIPCDVPEVAE